MSSNNNVSFFSNSSDMCFIPANAAVRFESVFSLLLEETDRKCPLTRLTTCSIWRSAPIDVSNFPFYCLQIVHRKFPGQFFHSVFLIDDKEIEEFPGHTWNCCYVLLRHTSNILKVV